jgi:arsenical pump membrane protein
VLANLVTNIPATLVALPLAGGDVTAALALLVGVGVGPNLVPSASLATLLWLAVLRRRGQEVRLRRLLAVGALAAPAGVAAGLAVVLLLGG